MPFVPPSPASAQFGSKLSSSSHQSPDTESQSDTQVQSSQRTFSEVFTITENVWKCLQKALVGAYSAIVKSSRTFVASCNTGGGAAASSAETAASHWKQEAKKPHRLSGSTLKWFVSVFCHAWCFIVTFSNDQIAGWTDKNWNYSSSSVDIFHRVESIIDW